MNAAENKRLLQQIFAGLAAGDARPFVQAMADDFRWILGGTTPWSRTYDGKEVVLAELFGPLRRKLADRIRTVPLRFIADGDVVAVEARGRNVTREGVPYENRYCLVFTLAGGKLREVTEYLDTELVTRVLGEPAAVAA
jgi:ketosteroid isomerase-like protein